MPKKEIRYPNMLECKHNIVSMIVLHVDCERDHKQNYPSSSPMWQVALGAICQHWEWHSSCCYHLVYNGKQEWHCLMKSKWNAHQRKCFRLLTPAAVELDKSKQKGQKPFCVAYFLLQHIAICAFQTQTRGAASKISIKTISLLSSQQSSNWIFIVSFYLVLVTTGSCMEYCRTWSIICNMAALLDNAMALQVTITLQSFWVVLGTCAARTQKVHLPPT